MDKYTILNEAIKTNPELIETFIGEDETAAFAKASEIAPGITVEEFAIYRADRQKKYPVCTSIAAMLKKAHEDKVFSAKLNSCQTPHDVYVLGKDVITVPEEEFAVVCEQLQAAAQADGVELSDAELEGVVGGSIGSWFKKHKWSIYNVAKTVASIASTVLICIPVTQPIGIGLGIGVAAIGGTVDMVRNEMSKKA